MGITCVSEIKRFCKDAYEVDGFAVLHTVHDLPRSGNTLQCGEGVAIYLDPVMTVAWQDAGEVWTVFSSRIVCACL